MVMMTRRQTIPDDMITEETLGKIIEKFLIERDDIQDIAQKDVVEFSLPLKLSNKTIARLINALIDGANATAGSVNQLIRFKNKQNDKNQKMLSELMAKLQGEV